MCPPLGWRLVLAAFAILAGACAQPAPAPVGPVTEDLRGAYTSDTDSFPRLRYASGTVTLNDRCPVRKSKLNRNLRPLFVNGEPIGFC